MFNFEAIHWGNRDMWWLLLLPLATVPAWISYELFHRRVRRSFGGRGLVEGMIRGAGFGRRLATFTCVLIALELMSVAAMRPKYGLKDFTVKGTGVDVAIVIDASRSMKTDDVRPDRLGISVMTVSKVMEKAAGNRFSLVPFAGIAFIQSPLTVDQGIIRQYLNDLRVTDMPVAGTAMGRALSTAARSLGVGASGFKGSAGKAIIVLTDGENHEGEPIEIASELADDGVRIFTIGVGTPEGRPIPKLDEKGEVVGLAPPENGDGPVISKLDEELLKTMADKTGGRYYSLSSVASIDAVSQGLAADLESMQRDEYLTAVERLLEERFQYPLAAGLLILALPFLWMGMRGRKKFAGTIAALVVLSVAPSPASAEPFENPVLAALFNRQQPDIKAASRLIADGKFGDALKKLQEAAGKLPPAPAIEYDTAIAAMLAGEFQVAQDAVEKAINLNKALSPTSPQHLPESDLLATKGSILVEKAGKLMKEGGERREAMTYYRQATDAFVSALLLDPTDEELRRTLEIVSLAAWPACSSLDDTHEKNDSIEQASPLVPDAQTGAIAERLLLCPDNHDWFSLTLRPGETVNLSVQKPSKEDAQAAQAGQEPPEPEPADVDVELVAPDGSSLVPPGKSARYTSRAAVDTTILLYVNGPSVEDGVDYVINAAIVPSCLAGGDDRMEDNDQMGAAPAVQDGKLDLRMCPLDDDFFEYTLQKETARQVKLSFQDQDGPLDLAVLADDGVPIEVETQTAPDGQSKVALLPQSDSESKFTIAVSGGGSEGFYRLEIGDPEGDKKQDQDQDQDKKDDENEDDDKDENKEQPPQPQGSSAIRQLIDELDSNRENIDAREAERNSSLGNHTPDKDW